jgi:hypothetical protein
MLFMQLKIYSVTFCQNGLATKVEKSRKQIKERKNRSKKIRGVKKVSSYDNTGTLQFLYAGSVLTNIVVYVDTLVFCRPRTLAGKRSKHSFTFALLGLLLSVVWWRQHNNIPISFFPSVLKSGFHIPGCEPS